MADLESGTRHLSIRPHEQCIKPRCPDIRREANQVPSGLDDSRYRVQCQIPGWCKDALILGIHVGVLEPAAGLQHADELLEYLADGAVVNEKVGMLDIDDVVLL